MVPDIVGAPDLAMWALPRRPEAPEGSLSPYCKRLPCAGHDAFAVEFVVVSGNNDKRHIRASGKRHDAPLWSNVVGAARVQSVLNRLKRYEIRRPSAAATGGGTRQAKYDDRQ